MDHRTHDWIRSLPYGGHWVYHLLAPVPGVPVEEELTSVYIGVTSNLRERLASHARKPWWVFVDVTLSELQQFRGRGEAEYVVRVMIDDYRPVINIRGLR